MFVGVMQLQLALTDNASLKDKRSVVKRVAHRIGNTFNVAVAEVDAQDRLDAAVLGVAAVSASRPYIEGLLQKVESFVDRLGLGRLLDAPKSIEHY